MNNTSEINQQAIESIFRAKNFYTGRNRRELFEEYLIPRKIWSVLKDYSISGNIKLFVQCYDRYNKDGITDRLIKNGEWFLKDHRYC